MTQPAKVQEPSMEEILASIRRIIADDEAKPAAAKPEAAAAAPPKPVMKDIPPSAIAPKPAAPKPAPAPPPPAPAPEPAASNNQDDIDAMLASLDAATPETEIRPAQPEADVFELTDEMALPDPPPPPKASFNKIEPEDDIEFSESHRGRQPAHEPPPFEPPQQPILSRSTVSAVESAFNSLANTVLSNNARTLEDLVKEMLRPMLKSWLDDNLPGLVERIVKAEIERVSRGR
ncbi:cell pole-organizing protein PopZ [Bradyrhizobium sp. AZCC 1588]|uniref:PopZ family protein n=1 Tax=unclassified Bradyrhizobium TaxID=2631580 RepID=UPI002FF29B61